MSSISSVSTHPTYQVDKPLEVTPVIPNLNSVGLLNLFFSIMKVLYIQNCLSLAGNKQKVETLDQENTLLNEKRHIEEIKVGEKEKTSSAWSTAFAVFSWMTSFTQCLAGAFLIASGNVISGALLIAGGVIQLTSQVMQMTGGWDKVAELIPAEDHDEKKAIVTWMQLGIGILSLMLGASGGIVSGKEAIQEGMSMANIVAGGVASIAKGTCEIGQGVSSKEMYSAKSRAEFFKVESEKLRIARKDLMEDTTIRIDRITEIMEGFSFALKIAEEENRANQRVLGG